MQKKIKFILASFILLSLATFYGCDFDGIGKDDNGNDIPLLRLALPVPSDATYNINFVDYLTKAPIDKGLIAEPMHFRATRPDGNNQINDLSQLLVTDACKVNLKYFPSDGVVALNLNPNVRITKDKPVGFMVAALEGSYGGAETDLNNKYISVPRLFKQSVPGHREIFIDMVHTSGAGGSQLSGVNVTGGQLVTALPGINNGNGYDYVGLYKATLNAVSVSADVAQFSECGIYQYKDNLWNPPVAGVTLESGDYFFVVVKKKNVEEGAINININSTSTASATFEYTITTTSGSVITGVISGNLPLKETVEQLYVPSTMKGATVKLTTIAPFKVTTQTVTVPDVTVAGGANVDFEVTVEETQGPITYDLYNLDVIIGCKSDLAMSYAMTKQFKYRIGDTSMADDAGEWADGHLIKGKSTIYMQDNQMYTFKVLVDNVWYKYNITTDPSKIDEVLSVNREYIKSYSMTKSGNTTTIAAYLIASEFCNL